MNNITLGGRLTRDSELRYMNDGLAVTSCAIAVDRPFSEGTDFFNIVAFGKKGETLAEIGLKGRFINLHGYLKTDNYKDKQGNDRRSFSVVVSNFIVVDWNNKEDKNQTASGAAYQKKQQEIPMRNFDDDDDLPF